MNDDPGLRSQEPFNRRTVELLVSLDAVESDPGEDFYLTLTGKCLGKADMKAVRSATPADRAQADLIVAARRDAALARYEDKRQLANDLLAPYDNGQADITEIADRMMPDERAEVAEIAGRLHRQPPEPPADDEAAVNEIHRLARTALQAQAFLQSDRAQPQKDEARTLIRLIEASKAPLLGEPRTGRIPITADEAAAKMAELNERDPAEPAA